MIDAADLTLSEGERRRLIVWAAACGARLLPVFSAERPDDGRLDDAIAGAAAFADGALGVGAMRTLAFAGHAAARDAVSPEATAVARAVGQAAAVAHMAAHGREIPRYTRKALTGEALVAELAWQRETVPADFASYVFG
ncbi:putative immunity protein [Clavibacter sp. Sh2088]|uniref:putative immunity protein n=1 Tax=Clavibacter sp. Sh2088 TaxID=3397676 RepID=UPI0039DFC198